MPTGESTAFGTLLRRYRREARLTQEQLAERAGVSARAITALERGVNRAPHRETFRLLADALTLDATARATLEAATSPRQPLADDQTITQRLEGATRSPFVGRAREMARLQRFLGGDGPSFLLVCGEPGIGKSRLLREAELLASQRGMTLLEGGCHWNTCQEPYAPLINALEYHLAHQSPAQRRAHLRGCAWLTRLLPEVEADIGQPGSSWPLAPEQERRLTFGAVVRYLGNIAGPSGTLLVVDDLHWIGPDVSDLLLHLVRAAPSIGLRILAGYRDTEVYLPLPLATTIISLVRDGEAARMEIGPLATTEARDLLTRLLNGPDGVSEGDASTRDMVLKRGEGIPFYLVSCALALRNGALSEGAPDDVPWDVAQSIRQRLIVLPDAAQDLICAAAVVGQEASGRLLARAAGHPMAETLTALSAACRARLLVEDETGAYHFAHDVIRDVAIEDVGTTRRQILHGRIAEALEQENSEQWLEALVYHYMRSDMKPRALEYLEQAAERALAQHAHATALMFYRQQVEVLQELGRTADVAAVREQLGAALYVAAWHDEALEHLTLAADFYSASDDREALARVTAQIDAIRGRLNDKNDQNHTD
jgi:predicted ATPase/DNA-binding XRE family transcriptional regulator